MRKLPFPNRGGAYRHEGDRLVDANTPPAIVSSMIGLNGDGCEIYEITVETIGYFSKQLKHFVNPRIAPNHGVSWRAIEETRRSAVRMPARAVWTSSQPTRYPPVIHRLVCNRMTRGSV